MEEVLFSAEPLQGASWSGIPRLAVLTGVNGVGKSRALQEMSQQSGAVLIKEFLSGGNVPLVELPATILSRYQAEILDWLNAPQTAPANPSWKEVAEAIQRKCRPPYDRSAAWNSIRDLITVPNDAFQTPVAFIEGWCTEYSACMRHDLIPAAEADLAGITEMLRAQDFTDKEILDALCDRKKLEGNASRLLEKQLPPSPVDDLSAILERLGSPYRARMDGDGPGMLRFYIPPEGKSFRSVDLSDGEWLTVYIAMIEFVATRTVQGDRSFKCLLLDEPDRHFDPVLCGVMMAALRRVSEEVQVILTTHRLDTVALARPEELFELVAGPAPPIFQRATKAQAACRMMYNVTSLFGLRIRVHTEAPNDARFYHGLYSKVFHWICNKARDEANALQRLLDVEHLLSPTFKMVFVSNAKEIGGSTQVTHAIRREVREVDQLHKLGLLGSGIFSDPCFHKPFGIKDLDAGAPIHDKERVVQGQRYALENYLLDPFVLAYLREEISPKLKPSYRKLLPSVLAQLHPSVRSEKRGELVAQFFKLLPLTTSSTEVDRLAQRIEDKEKKLADPAAKKLDSKKVAREKQRLRQLKAEHTAMTESASVEHYVSCCYVNLATGEDFAIEVPRTFVSSNAKRLVRELFAGMDTEHIVSKFLIAGQPLPPLPLDLVKMLFDLDQLIRKQVEQGLTTTQV